MNLNHRTKLSLCQFLILFDSDELVLLLGKHGISTADLENRWGGKSVAATTRETILRASASQLGNILQELVRTRSSMRTSVSPRYRFDERWVDLLYCLELDGYVKARNEYNVELDYFVPVEPEIDGAHVVEDDLSRELSRSDLSTAEEIRRVLENSSTAFRRGDFNGCLSNARVALQTLATSVARARSSTHPGGFDANKWGQTLAYLRTSGFVTPEQEQGLAGVFSFASPGSHTPVGLTDREFARLGRGLVNSCCYFLAKRWNASRQSFG